MLANASRSDSCQQRSRMRGVSIIIEDVPTKPWSGCVIQPAVFKLPLFLCQAIGVTFPCSTRLNFSSFVVKSEVSAVARPAFPVHPKPSLVQVNTAPRVSVEPQAPWAVRVPFDVPNASLTIGSVGVDHEVNVPAGHRGLVFEALPGEIARDHDYPFVFKLKFCADPRPDFEILRQGGELTANKVLRKDS